MEATEKQVRFIDRLVEEREIPPTGSARLLLEMWDFDWTRETATVLIDELMALPRLREDKAPAPSGLHVLDGEVYRVQVSRGSGRPYALLLVAACTGAFEYAPGAVRRLSEDTLMTLEEARDYGVRYGVCAACGRTLTNPESIEYGCVRAAAHVTGLDTAC